jgi:hypothetical protein
MSKLVENEQAKLLAGFCNTVAAAFLTTGILGPVVTTIYGFGSRSMDFDVVILNSVVCMLISVLLHIAGRSALARMIE